MNLKRRVAHLEGGGGPGREHVVVIYEDETDDQAIDFYGRDRIGDRDSILFVKLTDRHRSISAATTRGVA